MLTVTNWRATLVCDFNRAVRSSGILQFRSGHVDLLQTILRLLFDPRPNPNLVEGESEIVSEYSADGEGTRWWWIANALTDEVSELT